MSYVDEVYERVVKQNPGEAEFHQAVKEVLDSLRLVIEDVYKRQVEKKAIQVLENTYIRMEFDEDSLIHRLIYKPEETVLAEKVDDLLVRCV